MKKNISIRKNIGFTLIELVIAVAIVGIIAAVAIPEYNSQKRKGFRSDAIVLLTTAAQLQERYRSESNNAAYSNIPDDLTPKPGVTTSPKGRYQLTIENYSATTYTLVATAISGQAQDTTCAKFKLSHTGVKTALKSDASNSTSCWPS